MNDFRAAEVLESGMAGIFVMGLAYVLSQFFRSFLAVIAPDLSTDLGAGPADLGRASGAWFLAFGLMQIPVGLALDRLGPRRTAATLFLLGGAGGAALFSSAQGPSGLVVGMALVGVGCAPVLMASFYIFARLYDPARFAFLASTMVAAGTALGNLGAAAPLAWAVELFGWRASMAGLAAAVAVVCALIVLVLRDPPRAEGEGGDAGFGEFLAILRMPGFWPILVLMSASYMAPAGIRGLWAGPWLADVHGLDALAIGAATTWMALGMAAGAFAYGPLDRWFDTRKWIIFPGNFAVALLCLALAAAPDSPAWLGIAAFVAIGAFGMTYGVVMAHGRARLPAHLVGRGVTLLNFASMCGVGLAQLATGEIAQSFSGDLAQGYASVFLFYGATLGAAALVYLAFARDVRPSGR